jgi:hypothetical protein
MMIVSSWGCGVVLPHLSGSAGTPCRDLLDNPGIAVWIVEGEERPVTRALGVRAFNPRLRRERRAMPHVAHLDTTTDQILMSRYDVGYDERTRGGTRSGCGYSLAERDRAPRARRRELDDANAVSWDNVVVAPPTQTPVELLGSLDIGYGDDVDL